MTFSWQNALSTMKHSNLIKFAFLLGIIFSFSTTVVSAQDAAPVDEALWAEGKELFRPNCGACHHPVDPSTGPALSGALERWEKEGEHDGIDGKTWIYRWIKNNQEVLSTGHPYANEVFNEYEKSPMNLFPALTDEEIDAILYYADNHDAVGPKVVETDGPVVAENNFPIKTFLAILVLGLLAIVLVLIRVSGGLRKIALEKSGEVAEPSVPFWKSPKLRTLIVLAGLIFLGYFTVSNATATGRQQNYSPEQPIKYDHKLHAGVNQIECQYCHSGAAESKHSNIPSVNVCMNCHKNVKEGPTYGRKEISKIYAAIGFNPNSGKYFNTKEVSKADVQKELKEYLMADLGDAPSKEELKALDADLATTMDMYNRPVEWVRIHNMPDHVYFNHAQHVNAGGVECQTCHGDIQEMEVVAQHAPLSMGWCINCHRQTEVDLGNDYYSVYEKYHEDLASGAMDKVTVEDIGGTECQKCHY